MRREKEKHVDDGGIVLRDHGHRFQHFLGDAGVVQPVHEEIEEHLNRGIVEVEVFFSEQLAKQQDVPPSSRIVVQVESRRLINEVENANRSVHELRVMNRANDVRHSECGSRRQSDHRHSVRYHKSR